MKTEGQRVGGDDSIPKGPVVWRIKQGVREYWVPHATFVKSSYDTGAMAPAYALPEGWRVERDKQGRMLVSTPEGGGCVLAEAGEASEAQGKEQILLALLKGMGF